MHLPWHKSKDLQLDLLDAEFGPDESQHLALPNITREVSKPPPAKPTATPGRGHPMFVSVALPDEDPANPRTEFPDAELDELADSIRQHGILEAIVVHPADAQGRHRIHFGAKRLRAAKRAGLDEVPIVVRRAAADQYAQVAENQKRHGLTPLDVARLIRARVDAGESNTTIAQRLGMNLTTVAHHLALLELPPELDDALKSGRFTSPRTLHELHQLQSEQPEPVRELLASSAEITRTAVNALRAKANDGRSDGPTQIPLAMHIAQAYAACDRLEQALRRIDAFDDQGEPAELLALRIRVEDITKLWLQGSDRQTPSQADR